MAGLCVGRTHLQTPALLCVHFLAFHPLLPSAFNTKPQPVSQGRISLRKAASLCSQTNFPISGRTLGAGGRVQRRYRSVTACVDAPEKSPEEYHVSVLRDEVLDVFSDVNVRNFIDGTLGMGGHSFSICEGHADTLQLLLGVDQDPTALNLAGQRLAPFKEKTKLVNGNFADLAMLAQENGLEHGSVDGILLDIGTSSLQLDEASRGFSFMRDGPLDMRMDPNGPLTAADIVNSWSEEEIAQVLWEFGEERKSRSMARKIVRARDEKPIETTLELCKVIGGARHGKGIHPATLAFQGLRIAVNRELHVLDTVLPQAVDLLGPGGRLAVISFHSLEDRIVKTFFREVSGAEQRTHRNKYARDEPPPPEPGSLRVLTKRPKAETVCWRGNDTNGGRQITAQPGEEKINPRSRSAKLRVIEKV